MLEKINYCAYGCGSIANYKNKSNNWMCSKSHNNCPVNRSKNSEKLKKIYEQGRNQKEIYQNLSDEKKEKMNWNKGKRNADFSYGGKGNHKGVLIKERGHLCECCKSTKWLDKDIVLELEHIDGDNKNNTKENLKLLCPNCHSLTNTWRGRKSLKINTEDDVLSPYLIQGRNKKYKKDLIKERGYLCECCKNSKWLNKGIILELEHVDGNIKNNGKDNLKLYCPNCHALTDTWRGKKNKIEKTMGKKKHTDEVIIDAVKNSINMNQVLIKLDYRYGSKTTVLKIMEKYNINFLVEKI